MNAPTLSETKTSNLLAELDRRLSEQFPCHPFEVGINSNNFERVIAEYLAMSISFPYIQAGAIYANYKLARDAINDTDKSVEITAAIGSFLVWDEFGGHALTQKRGNEALRYLTNVDKNFHSNLLRRDIETILGKHVKPSWSTLTSDYLNGLLAGLSDHNDNVAHMVSFESHAHVMIESMWNAIHRLFSLPKDSRLTYFYEHVGGDSPAEVFHVEMTQRMVCHLVPEHAHNRFLASCINAYAANIRWCESILALTPSD